MQCRGRYCQVAAQAQEGRARCYYGEAPETPKGAYRNPKVAHQGQVFDLPDNIGHKQRFQQLYWRLSQEQTKAPGGTPLNLLLSFHEVSYSMSFVQGGCGAANNEPGGSRCVC